MTGAYQMVFAWERLVFHAPRLPLYWGRLAVRAPVGLGRMCRKTYLWVFDVPGRPPGDVDHRLRASLYDQHMERLWARLAGSTAALGFAVFMFISVMASTTVVAHWLLLVITLPLLGLAGQGKVVDKAPQRTGGRKPLLTNDMVAEAFLALGIAELTRAITKGEGLEFMGPPREDGPGWRVDVLLPRGVTATDIIERREKLSSGLRRKLGCVWPEQDLDDHPGHLILWVGHKPMAETPQPAWTLMDDGEVNIFKAQPIGTDPRGRWVKVTLMYAAVVIGAVPRVGKTFALRLLLLIAALDKRTELHVFDCKGTGDLAALQKIAKAYRAGDDEDDIMYALEDMRSLQQEMRRRTKVIRELPHSRCPENKVTDELASDQSLGLHPIVIGVDECQRWFEHPQFGDAFTALVTDIVKRGPALGFIPMMATQRPDAKSLPTSISSNAVIRFCLKVMGHIANDMVLGTGAYKDGIRATMFSRSDLGIGYLVGEGEDAKILHTVKIDNVMAKKIEQRIIAIRQHEYIDAPAISARRTPEATLLADILEVFPEEKIWPEVLLGRLRRHVPDKYSEWTEDHLTAALATYGIRKPHQVARTVDGVRQNRRGYARVDVLASATRDATRGSGDATVAHR